MNIALIGAVAFAAAQSVNPTGSDPSVALWGPLRSGMTKPEVKAVQPNPVVTISDMCTGWLDYTYERKKLKAVRMTAGAKAGPECTVLTEKTLLAKYGSDPRRQTQYVTGDCGYGTLGKLCRAMGGDKTIRYSSAQWVASGVRVIFTRSDANNDWTVDYTVEPQVTADTVHAF